MEPPLSTGSGRGLLSRLRQLPEPVQLLYVIMFSVSMIPKDSLYIDKVCQVVIRIIMMMILIIMRMMLQVNLKEWMDDNNITRDSCNHLTDNNYSMVQNKTQEKVSELKVRRKCNILNIDTVCELRTNIYY